MSAGERSDEGRAREGSAPGRVADALLGAVSAVLLSGMALLIAVDVFGRALLDQPVPGAYELTSMLLAVLVFTALPLTTLRGGHVVVDLADQVLPAAAIRWLSAVMEFASGLALAGFAVLLFEHGESLAWTGDVTNTLRLPLYPVAYLMAAASAVAAAATVCRSLAGMRAKG